MHPKENGSVFDGMLYQALGRRLVGRENYAPEGISGSFNVPKLSELGKIFFMESSAHETPHQ